MKKYYAFAALMLAAAVSCTKETAVEEVLAPKQGYVEITLTAQSGMDSKASLDGKNVIWEEGEKVAVFTTASAEPELFTVKAVDGTTVTITGSVPESATSFIAAYPYENAVSCADGVVKMTVKSTQTVGAEGVDGGALNSVAVFESVADTPVFKNAVALVKFSVEAEGVTSVSLAPVTSGAFGGEVSVSAATAEISSSENAEGGVVVECEKGFTKDAVYYAAVAPGAFEGLKASLLKGGKRGVRTSEASMTVERNAVVTLGAIDSGISEWKYGVIKTGEELAEFLAEASTYTADDLVELGNDIDLEGISVTPAKSFAGTFDGHEYSVKNWVTKKAMFSALGGTIKNLTIDKSCKYTPATSGQGALIAQSTSAGSLVYNCVNNSDVSITANITKAYKIGTIVGTASGVVEACTNNGNFIINVASSSGAHCIGGVVGYFVGGDEGTSYIKDCVNNGEVSFTCEGTPQKTYLGGIVGASPIKAITSAVKVGIVEGCTNSGAVTWKAGTPGNGTYCNIGGVAGYLEADIKDCVNTGAVTIGNELTADVCTRPSVGGVAGYVVYNASNCSNSGAVTMTGSYSAGTAAAAGAGGSHQPLAGGVFGGIGKDAYDAGTSLNGCTNSGTLTVNTLQKSKGGTQLYVGGIAGYCAVKVEDCENSGDVDAKGGQKTVRVGGVIGSQTGDSITGCKNSGTITQDAAGRYNATDAYAYQNYVAGIVSHITGTAASKAVIADCENTGDVILKGVVESSVYHYAGGILGQYSGALKSVDNCSNSGNISAEAYAGSTLKARVGGIGAAMNATDGVSSSKNTGDVSLSGGSAGSQTGGFAGYWGEGSTTDCSSGGKVTSDSAAGSYAGGFVGALNVDVTWAGLGLKSSVTASEGEYAGAIIGGFSAEGKTLTIDGYDTEATVNGDGIAEDNIAAYLNGGSIVGWGSPKSLTIERLWGKYPNTGWPTEYMAANADRGVATDGEYVYIANANTTGPEVVAINIADQSKKTVNVTGVEGGFFATCCARTIYNPATGKYILLVGSLANEGDGTFNVYAWTDGIDAAPIKLISWNTNNGSVRRVGDFFTVSGDWSKGEIWARINLTDPAAATTFVWKITDGVAGGVLGGGIGYGGSAGMGSVYKYSIDAPQVMVVTPDIAKFYKCTVESSWINADNSGIDWTNGSDVSAYAKRFGYTPFEYNGKKYIAYLHMHNGARGWLTILNDTQGTAEGFMQTIIDNDIFFQGAVQIEKDEPSTAVVDGATYSGNTMANCSVAVMEDHVILVGHQQNTGLAVFKMYLK